MVHICFKIIRSVIVMTMIILGLTVVIGSETYLMGISVEYFDEGQIPLMVI